MSGFGCDNLPFVAVFAALLPNIVLLLGNLSLLIRTGKFLLHNSKLTKKLKTAYMVTILSLCVSSASATMQMLLFFLCPSRRYKSILYEISSIVVIQTAWTSTILLQIFFTLRFTNSFNDSLLTISKRLKYLFYFLSIIECVAWFIILVLMILFLLTNETIFLGIMSMSTYLFFLVYLIHFILLAVNFRQKLKQFAIIVCKNKKGLQNHIFGLIHKLFICWLLAFCSTFCSYTFFILSNVIVNKANWRNSSDYIMIPLILTVSNTDLLINNVAVAMQFKFGHPLYIKLCKKCDHKVKRCCQLQDNDANTDIQS